MIRMAQILAAGLLLSSAAPAMAAPWTLFPAPEAKPVTAIERGAIVFQGRCEICHGKGNDRSGTISLGFKYQGAKPALLAERRDLTPALVRFYVRNGVAMMPYFRKTELSDPELDDLAAYLSRKQPR